MSRLALSSSPMHGWKSLALRFGYHRLLLTIVATAAPFASVLETASATPPITPSGLNTQISTPHVVGGQIQYDITGGTRPGSGTNLFHSFGDFNVPNNTIANFHNDSGLPTTNILGRVTGGNISNIYGSIQTTDFGNANLFLANPAGFLFGPGAMLNVGGMVTFTSADYLKLNDGTRFNAIPNSTADAVLSASPVATFGFLGSNSASIAIQGGTLEVAQGKTLAFIGGPHAFATGTGLAVPSGVSMSGGSLSAPNGLIYMATVTNPGEIPLPTLSGAPLGNLVSPSPGPAAIRIRGGEFVMDHALLTTTTNNTSQLPIEISVQGNLELRNGSAIDTSTAPSSTGRGGNINIQARQVLIKEATVKSETAGLGDAGSIVMQGNDSISLIDSVVSNASTLPVATANGGLIRLQAPRIEVRGSQVLSSTEGQGSAGSISLLGIQNIASLISLKGSTLSTETRGTGGSGTITIDNTQTIKITDGSTISTLSESKGHAGNIVLTAIDSIQLSESSLSSDAASFSSSVGGDGGLIHLQAPTINIHNDSVLSTSTFGIGNAGTVLLEAKNLNIGSESRISAFTQSTGHGGNIIIRGLNGLGSRANDVNMAGASLLQSRTSATGDAGDVSITAGHLTITNDSRINASTETGTGSGGNISIDATSLTIENSGIVAATTSGSNASAHGGTIKLKAGTILLNTNASITTSSTGLAEAGDIRITATNGLSMQNSSITTQVDQGATGSSVGGGNITITTAPMATAIIQNSTISASVPGKGKGGNISIDPQYVILQNGKILAQADKGAGGSITVFTGVFLSDTTSIISADAGQGVNGTVTIQSPNAPASGKIQPLGNHPLQTLPLLLQRCAAIAEGKFSSFIVARPHNRPTEPVEWHLSPLPLAAFAEDKNRILQKENGLQHDVRSPFFRSMRQTTPLNLTMHPYGSDSPSENCW